MLMMPVTIDLYITMLYLLVLLYSTCILHFFVGVELKKKKEQEYLTPFFYLFFIFYFFFIFQFFIFQNITVMQ